MPRTRSTIPAQPGEMTTEHQNSLFNLWANGTGFVLDPESSLKREFARLAKARGWVGGGTEWNRCWLQVFNEEYGYIPQSELRTRQESTNTNSTRHTPSPLPPVSNQASVNHRPRFAMSPDLEMKHDFFRICHAGRILPTQTTWCQRWNECFQEEWSMEGSGPYETAGECSSMRTTPSV